MDMGTTNPVWFNYTYETNTVYWGPSTISYTVNSKYGTDTDCAEHCNKDATCTWWAFCPVMEG
jgi:hypothetical protein